ncbi:cation-transporting P-type ATPase [Nocardia sp. NPDC051981]|uniref:cation-transporting P-type ATPase n=1 Tax=Nocardia sp. NPDC051981 TaxID=3155417 RepID=UPI0034291281
MICAAAVGGVTAGEAERRLLQYRQNVLRRRGGRQWPGALARQLTHPLALLLWLAAGLLLIVGSHVVAAAVVLIIVRSRLPGSRSGPDRASRSARP